MLNTNYKLHPIYFYNLPSHVFRSIRSIHWSPSIFNGVWTLPYMGSFLEWKYTLEIPLGSFGINGYTAVKLGILPYEPSCYL